MTLALKLGGRFSWRQELCTRLLYLKMRGDAFLSTSSCIFVRTALFASRSRRHEVNPGIRRFIIAFALARHWSNRFPFRTSF